MELVLIRHALPVRVDAGPATGPATGSPPGPPPGPADPGLAPAGRDQAARLPAALAHDTVTALYSSPAARARETAAPLARALGLPVHVDPGLAEFDAADPSYVPVEELRASRDPRWDRLVRGELYSEGVDPVQFRARVVAAVEAIAAANPGGCAVLVSHAGAINAYTGHLLGQDRSLWFAPAYCSVTRVAAARDGRRGVLSLNETAHVRDLLPR